MISFLRTVTTGSFLLVFISVQHIVSVVRDNALKVTILFLP